MFKINLELKQTLFVVLLHISDILIYLGCDDDIFKNVLIQVITNKCLSL